LTSMGFWETKRIMIKQITIETTNIHNTVLG